MLLSCDSSRTKPGKSVRPRKPAGVVPAAVSVLVTKYGRPSGPASTAEGVAVENVAVSVFVSPTVVVVKVGVMPENSTRPGPWKITESTAKFVAAAPFTRADA